MYSLTLQERRLPKPYLDSIDGFFRGENRTGLYNRKPPLACAGSARIRPRMSIGRGTGDGTASRPCRPIAEPVGICHKTRFGQADNRHDGGNRHDQPGFHDAIRLHRRVIRRQGSARYGIYAIIYA